MYEGKEVLSSSEKELLEERLSSFPYQDSKFEDLVILNAIYENRNIGEAEKKFAV